MPTMKANRKPYTGRVKNARRQNRTWCQEALVQIHTRVPEIFPPNVVEVFKLMYVEGHSAATVADWLGAKLCTVRRRAERLKAAFPLLEQNAYPELRFYKAYLDRAKILKDKGIVLKRAYRRVKGRAVNVRSRVV